MNVLLEEFVLPPDLEKILDNSPSIIIPKTEEMLYGLIFGNNGTNTNQVDVCYRVNGELVKEAVVSRCKNGAAVNFTEDYMRRRDPDCMRIGDDLPTDKPRFKDVYGYDFEKLKIETYKWLARQELILVPFMAGGKEYGYEALLVGMDVPTDLAVLKIDAQNLHPAVFGNSDELQVGDTVVAIGNPLGQELRGTMTDGIISAINRDVDVDGYSMVLIQTTAALNSGNSGGALINEYGQVVGITNMKMSAYDDTVEGLGFAIPTTTVKTVVDDLIRQGYVSGEPSIGITCYTVTEEMAEEYDLPLGVYVKSVQQDSDAKKQGVFPGDVIVEANGQSITTIEELLALKEGMEAGDVIHFRLWRSGGYLERDVTLMEQYVP